MVRNKRELLAAASEWVNHAKDDIHHSLTQFMERTGADVNRMADILGTSVAEVQSIISGTGDITLSTFAKLLIATDNAIEIKPVSAVMGQGHRGGFPTPSQMQSQVARRGGSTNVGDMPMPPMPPMGGRQMPPMAQGCDMMEVDLDRLHTTELHQLALRDGFSASEISGKSRSELIDMLEARQQEAIRRGEFGLEPSPWENDGLCEDPDYLLDDNEGAKEDPDLYDDLDPNENFDDCNRPLNYSEELVERAESPKRATDETLARVMVEELNNNPRLREIVSRHLRN